VFRILTALREKNEEFGVAPTRPHTVVSSVRPDGKACMGRKKGKEKGVSDGLDFQV